MARNKYDVDETLESSFDMKHLKRSLLYVKRYKKPMMIGLLCSAAATVCGLFVPVLTKEALDVAIPGKDIWSLVLLCLGMAVFIGVSIWLSEIRLKVMTKVGQNIVFDIRQDLFDHLQKLSFQYYDSRPHGKILVRVIQYVNNVSDMLSNGIINFFLEIFNLIFILVFMFAMSPRLSLVILTGIPILLIVVKIVKPIQRKGQQLYSNKSSNLNAYLHENLNGIRVTQIFTREELNKSIFEKLCMACKDQWMRVQYSANMVWVTVDILSRIITTLVYVAGVLWVKPMASFGTILSMGTYSGRFWQPILNLSNIYNNFINTIAYLERIFETMDEPVEIHDQPDAYKLPPVVGKVELQDVVFEYEKGHPILKGISFTVNPGESVALVGPTGAGKTTIVNLISRFYDITSGSLLIDGHSVSGVTLSSLRGQMGIMLQDSVIFSGTIADNIRYGKLDATQEEIEQAADIVMADGFIKEMEQGYDTEVNERGSRLSGGQKQLISFARTILSDPKILVLDEATASIDTKTEKLMQEGIQRMLKGRTSFIIAHRLSTIQSCDKIMYIDGGNVQEVGSHKELMAKKGKYYQLYTSQLQKAQ